MTVFHAKLTWACQSRFNCRFSLHSAQSIIWHWLGQLSQGNAPGNGCCLSHPSWLRISPTASHPCRTVPLVHRTLQRNNWELQSRAAVGSSTAGPSLLLYHFCEFPLRSLCHWKECRSVSIWITVRLVGAERMVKQKQNEVSKHAVGKVRRNAPTVFSKATCPNIHGVVPVATKVLQKPWTSYTILIMGLCEIKSSQMVIQTRGYWREKGWNKMFLLF